MLRALLFAMTLFSVGCGSSSGLPTHHPEPLRHVWDVTTGNLMRSAREYHGQTVRVKLNPLGYVVSGREIHYASPIQGSASALVFVCRDLPTGNETEIELTGRVIEIVYDGQPRTATVTWQVRIGECSFVRAER